MNHDTLRAKLRMMGLPEDRVYTYAFDREHGNTSQYLELRVRRDRVFAVVKTFSSTRAKVDRYPDIPPVDVMELARKFQAGEDLPKPWASIPEIRSSPPLFEGPQPSNPLT